MSRLIDLDQHITVPITDDHGTYTVEITVGEFFKRFLPGEQLKVVDAVPVEIIKKYRDFWNQLEHNWHVINFLLVEWQKEQEAR